MNPSLWVSYFIIGPLAPLVDWPFHSHFSHAKNLRFPLPEKCPFSLVQRPFVFCQRFSVSLGLIYSTIRSQYSGCLITVTPRLLHFFNFSFFIISPYDFFYFSHFSFFIFSPYNFFTFPAGPVSPYRLILLRAESPSAWGTRDGSPTL